jgi:hypothetical protein
MLTHRIRVRFPRWLNWEASRSRFDPGLFPHEECGIRPCTEIPDRSYS